MSSMPNQLPCLFCAELKGPFTGEAHVFPEGILANRFVLPPGVVCDPCNSYFGAHLDSAIVSHPFISFAIQFLALPGKARKPRKRLANVARDSDDRWITLPVEEPTRVKTADGRTKLRVRPLIDKTFRMQRFSRALYHIALSLLAKQDGHSFALRTHLDSARRYVRSPRKGAFLPFVMSSVDLTSIRLSIEGGRVPEAPGDTIGIRIFNFDFYLDLVNRGGLVEWAQRSLSEKFYVIDENWRPPTQSKGPPYFQLQVEAPRES